MNTSTGVHRSKGGSRSFGVGATIGCELPDMGPKFGSSRREEHAFNCRSIYSPTPDRTFHIQSNSNFSNLESPSSLTDESPGQVSGLRAGRQAG